LFQFLEERQRWPYFDGRFGIRLFIRSSGVIQAPRYSLRRYSGSRMDKVGLASRRVPCAVEFSESSLRRGVATRAVEARARPIAGASRPY
jgi:hypothetical protein